MADVSSVLVADARLCGAILAAADAGFGGHGRLKGVWGECISNGVVRVGVRGGLRVATQSRGDGTLP